MQNFIREAEKEIDNFFHDLWWVKHKLNIPHTKKSLSIALGKFSNQFNEHIELLFLHLNSSIFTGEYARIETFESDLNSLIAKANQIPIPNGIEEIINEFIFREYRPCLKAMVNEYLELHEKVKVKFLIDNTSYVSSASSYLDLNFEANINGLVRTQNQLTFLLCNLKIAEVDHFYTPNEIDFFKIEEIERVASSAVNSYNLLLSEKCTFLREKWMIRKEEMTSEFPVFYRNGIRYDFNPNQNTSSLLSTWREYILNHYDLEKRTNRSYITKRFEKIENNKSGTLNNFIEIHCTIKYYKDIKHDYKGLNTLRLNLKDKLKNTFKSSLPPCDWYALVLAYQYAMNNEFSLLLETKSKDGDSSEISSLYEEIETFQNDYGLKNFFPQYKYIRFLVNLLKKDYQNRSALDNLNKAKKIIQKCESIIEKYRINVKWSKLHYNYVFALPSKECMVNVTNNHISQVYLASSFALPISSESYVSDFELIRQEFYTYKSSVEIFENLERDIQDTRQSQIRQMEIIGVFTAIITFIAATIQAFTFVKTAYQAFLFMFALACSLCLFVMFSISILRGLTFNALINTSIVKQSSIACMVLWGALIFYSNDPILSDIDTKQEGKIDSIIKHNSLLQSTLDSFIIKQHQSPNHKKDTVRIHIKDKSIKSK